MDPTRSAVLLDIDGTLIDSTYHHAIAWQRAFDSLDLPIPLWRIHRAVGMGGDKLVAHVAGDDVEERQGDELRDRWRDEYLKIKAEVVPLPGAAELLHTLSKRGYQVALASSGDPEFSREAMETLGVAEEVAALTTSEDVDDSKPDPDLLQETLDRLDDVTHAVMVGDTPYDAESAAKAGMKCIGLRSGGYSEAELVDGGVVLVVDTPGDLIDVDWEKYLSALG
jgi:HAD superfamily hydrolase (TIGR01549 family)